MASGSLRIMQGLNSLSATNTEYLFTFDQVNVFPVSTKLTFFFRGKRPKTYDTNPGSAPSSTDYLEFVTLPADLSTVQFFNGRVTTGLNSSMVRAKEVFSYPASKYGDHEAVTLILTDVYSVPQYYDYKATEKQF